MKNNFLLGLGLNVIFFQIAFGQVDKFPVPVSHANLYESGFKHSIIYDYSRAYGNRPRPISLYIWYPTKQVKGTKMKFVEYLLREGSLVNQQDINALVSTFVQNQISSLKIDSLQAVVVADKTKQYVTDARKDATPAAGKFPVLLCSPGGTTPGYLFSLLGEYLASQGFVTVSFSSLGNEPAKRWNMNEGGTTLHADDLQVIVNYLKENFATADINQSVLVGGSIGGISQTFFHLKGFPARLFVSIDSGLGNTYGVELLNEDPFFDYKNFKIPFVQVIGEGKPHFVVEKSRVFYDSIASNRKLIVRFPHLSHHHFFPTLGLFSPFLGGTLDKKTLNSYLQLEQLLSVLCRSVLGPADDMNLRKAVESLNQPEKLYSID